MQEITAINVKLPPDLPEITTLFDANSHAISVKSRCIINEITS